jgi:hypothetical protein
MTAPIADAVPGRHVVVALLVLATVLVAGYWIVWFLVDRSILATETRPAYFEHEQSFVLADSWLGICTLLAAGTLWRRHPSALFWLIAGGGAGLFLGSMDALYDISRNDWFGAGSSGYIELGIVIITWLLSIGLMAWAWRNRAAILSSRKT